MTDNAYENSPDESTEEEFGKNIDLDTWKKLFAFTRPYRRELIIIIIAGIGAALLEASFPLITRAVIDDVAENGSDVNLWFMLASI
jgi:ABC-type bacteriocin/lantibiotic exporter with double-glycine peptidase domain